jgi:hypothetical protein
MRLGTIARPSVVASCGEAKEVCDMQEGSTVGPILLHSGTVPPIVALPTVR